jgi:hypothetical protein
MAGRATVPVAVFREARDIRDTRYFLATGTVALPRCEPVMWEGDRAGRLVS